MSLIQDGWTNVLTRLGIRGVDKSVSVEVAPVDFLSERKLAMIYAGDGLGAKIADCVAEDAARNGFKILGDDDDESLLKACEAVKLPQAIQLAHAYRRAFGGALLVAQYDRDASELTAPPSPTAIVTGFKVYACPRVKITSTDIVTDARSRYFEDVELFTVSKRYGGTFQVHASRCKAIKGIPVPDVPDMEYDTQLLYWGMSELQRVYGALSNFGAFFQAIGHLGQEMVIGKYRISNLEKLLLSNDVKAIQTRMEIINLQKSVLRAVLLGKDEEYSRDSLSFAGVPEVFDRMTMVISGTSGIPVTKLMGRSAAGMNASGEGDSRDYYDKVKAEQVGVVKEPLEWAITEVDRVVRSTKDHSVEFYPVWSPSQKEELEMRERQQKIDAGYIADGVYSAEECRKNRFVGGYSFDTRLDDPGDVPSPEDAQAHAEQLKEAEARAAERKAARGAANA